MHYYCHHVGDYHRDTAHLSILEHGVYRLLMDSYYSTGRALPSDHAVLCRIVRAVSKAEREAVLTVSAMFFTNDGGMLKHKRIEAELEAYHAKLQQASDAGRASAAKRQSVTKDQRPFNARSTGVEFPLERNGNEQGNENSTNQYPVTSNHIIITASATPQQCEDAKKPEKKPADPRFKPFIEIFAGCYQEAFGEKWVMNGAKDGKSLSRLLKALPDLTAETWQEALEWCQEIAAKPYSRSVVGHTGNLSAFCSNWSAIVAYSQTYQESK